MASEIRQEDFDNTVLGIAEHEIRITNILVDMKRQNDPDCWRRENELMLLQNVLYALKYYDVTADLLTDDEIRYLYELATLTIQGCPL